MPLIDVVVASTEIDLTTTGKVRTECGLTSSQTSDDSKISDAIRVASRWAESFIGRPVLAQKYREALPSYGTRSLKLARYPVRAVPSLYHTTTTEDEDTVASSEYQVNAAAGLLQRPGGWAWSAPAEQYLELRPLPGQEFPDWLVDYVAGWTLDGVSTDSALWSTEKGTTSTGRTLPEDIERAVVLKAAGVYQRTGSVASESVGDLSVSYRSGSVSAGSEETIAEQLLARYAGAV